MPNKALVLVGAAVLEARDQPSTGGGHEEGVGAQAVRAPQHLLPAYTLALSPSGRRPHRRRQAVAARHLPAPRPLTRRMQRVAHVVPGGLDPAVGTLDVRDAARVDMAVEVLSGHRYRWSFASPSIP